MSITTLQAPQWNSVFLHNHTVFMSELFALANHGSYMRHGPTCNVHTYQTHQLQRNAEEIQTNSSNTGNIFPILLWKPIQRVDILEVSVLSETELNSIQVTNFRITRYCADVNQSTPTVHRTAAEKAFTVCTVNYQRSLFIRSWSLWFWSLFFMQI